MSIQLVILVIDYFIRNLNSNLPTLEPMRLFLFLGSIFSANFANGCPDGAVLGPGDVCYKALSSGQTRVHTPRPSALIYSQFWISGQTSQDVCLDIH